MTRKIGDTLVASIPADGESLPERALVFWRVCYNHGSDFGV
jgi:hypothetical protein